jgi:probable addiction module antidote protein
MTTHTKAAKTGKIKLTDFDAAAHLDRPERIAAYLNLAFASGDTEEISDALGVVARAKGMSEVARHAKLGRQSLYKALSPQGNPSVDTLVRVMSALGLRLAAAEA